MNGIPGVGVKSVDIRRNAKSEGSSLDISDTERRKRGEQTGLDTLVVHAVNGVNLMWEDLTPSVS